MIIGWIRKIISSVLKAVYKILSVFNLQFALLVMAVGVVLYFCGVFENGGFALLIFCLSFMCSVLAAVFLTARKILGVAPKKKQKTPVQILNQPTQQLQQQVVQPSVQVQPQQVVQPVQQFVAQPVQVSQPVQQTQNFSNVYQTQQPIQEQPRYFRVRQNPNYVMAEYSDRYELYLITPNGLKLTRTDYKG